MAEAATHIRTVKPSEQITINGPCVITVDKKVRVRIDQIAFDVKADSRDTSHIASNDSAESGDG